MKIGIFGGSFDPIHLGHLLLAEAAREACGLNEIWFIPASHSPLKAVTPAATDKQRLEMLRLAVAGYPTFRVLDLEIKRKGISYTVDTLQAIVQQRPDAELHLIIGADSLHDFPKWKDPAEILKLATIVAMNRGRIPPSMLNTVLSLGEAAASRIQLVEMPAVDLSSSDIRARVASARSIRFQTPRAIEQYIQQHGLYLQ